ncbi:class I adenylate-forming enzyme family protein [Rhodococcus sp. X156]|uniref:class I adenylate-forming enzyme family protein n=1 Tax=Rhodococcus sp. X156 TaxID=2499145 RepID=UPI000FDCC77A|nr:class I adenylate-forming enzyme family protein [Rhodococcus sp. X156]
MTDQTTASDPRAEAMARLTAPGQRFELIEEDVRGNQMQVFAQRHRSLHELLTESAGYGDREYLVCDDLRLTYTEHLRRVASLSAVLRDEHGIGKGDRVAVLSANNAEWVITFWAATSLGAIVVGMNSLWSAREIAYGMEHSTPSLVVADAPRRELLGEVDVPVLSIEAVRELSLAHPDAELPPCVVVEDDPAVILYTSGTTGRAKGATHSHRNLICAVDYFRINDAVAAELGVPQGPRRFLLTGPLFHIMSLHNLVVPRLAFGDAAVIYTGRFEPDRILGLIERERINQWGAVPTMASRLLEHGVDGYDLSSLKSFSLGSAPSSPALKAGLRELLPVAGKALGTTYGLTESSTAATLATAADLVRNPESVGRAIVTVRVEVRDALGQAVPDGTEGEIYLRGPQVMLGYWNNPEATAATIDEQGWMRTGDLGTLRDGELQMSSRRSDLIIRGGENIYPAEVEAAIIEHPAVRECIVVGAPSEDLGQEVAAIVVVPDLSVTAEDLTAFVAERIARYKVPARWLVTDEELPRNATGKVMRKALPTAVGTAQ